MTCAAVRPTLERSSESLSPTFMRKGSGVWDVRVVWPKCWCASTSLPSILTPEIRCPGGCSAGRHWDERGNVVSNNRFSRIYQTEEIAETGNAVRGIYLDDMEAGWVLTGNYFDACDAAIFVGGGRQTTVVNNVSMDRQLTIYTWTLPQFHRSWLGSGGLTLL